jgi:AraC-like DNA-binding protein
LASAFVRWATRQFAPGDRFDAWHDALNLNYGRWASAPNRLPTFSATVECGLVDAFRVIECVCDPCAGQRTWADIGHNPEDIVALQLVLRGKEEVRFAGEEFLLRPGDILVWDSLRPMDFKVVEQLHKLSVILPLSRLRNWLPNRWQSIRRVIAPDSGAARLLSSYLQSLAPRKAVDGINNSDALIETTIGLLVNALELEPARSADCMREVQLERVRSYIDEHLSEPDLAPSKIAAANRISVRYLHWLFESIGTTVTQFVIRERLERCRRDLGNPMMRNRKIADVAFSWGFSDVTHFNRRFKTEFGMSPRLFSKMFADSCGAGA